MSRLILGVATNSGGEYKAYADGKNTKAYDTWHSMLKRAYCPKSLARFPAYIGCKVVDSWLEYQEFAAWYENHEYSDYGYQLDKDLLIPNNKIYAADRCVFIPHELNSLLTDSRAARGQYPQGVYFNKRDNKFKAQIRINGKNKGLGYYNDEMDAYHAYKTAKEAHVKHMANLWEDRIAAPVHHALIKWQLDS